MAEKCELPEFLICTVCHFDNNYNMVAATGRVYVCSIGCFGSFWPDDTSVVFLFWFPPFFFCLHVPADQFWLVYTQPLLGNDIRVFLQK